MLGSSIRGCTHLRVRTRLRHSAFARSTAALASFENTGPGDYLWPVTPHPYHHGMSVVVAEATIICPDCGTAHVETMPTNACQFFYTCSSCTSRLRPLPGDCCVFCSYSDQVCPPKQLGDECC
jgi:hypothetical protein